jgi:hypothetical protein
VLLDTRQPLLVETREPLSFPHRSGDTHAALDQVRQHQHGSADEDELGERAFVLDQDDEDDQRAQKSMALARQKAVATRQAVLFVVPCGEPACVHLTGFVPCGEAGRSGHTAVLDASLGSRLP